MPKERVSIKDIARQADVSVGTVSQALRTTGNTSAKTVLRIRQIAEAMGYIPNPLLASLARNHFKTESNSSKIPIAHLVQSSKDAPPDIVESDSRVIAAQQQAEKMGYMLSTVQYEQITNFKNYTRQLFYKGIQGIIFSPQVVPNLDQFLEVDWSPFRMVACCSDPRLTRFNQIDGNKYDTVLLACRMARTLGYRRIGFALMSHTPIHYDDKVRQAAAMICQRGLGPEEFIPILDAPMYDEQSYLQWYRTYRPEVVIGFHIRLAYWLMESGLSIPKDVSFIGLHHYVNSAEYCKYEAGIKAFEEKVAEMSVILMDQLIRHHTMGIVSDPVRILLHPTWVDGSSCPPKTG